MTLIDVAEARLRESIRMKSSIRSLLMFSPAVWTMKTSWPRMVSPIRV